MIPEDNKQRVLDLLRSENISFGIMEHEAVFTVEDVSRVGIDQKCNMCKNLFLRNANGKVHFLVTVPEHRAVDIKALAASLGSSRLSFGSAERLEKYLGVRQGSVSPLGILNDAQHEVIVVFDSSLVGESAVGVHPNDNTATIWLSFDDLRSLIEKQGNEVRTISLD